jgi:hypothetical protein
VLGAEFAGLWIQDTLRQKFLAVSVQDILQRGGSRFMETYVEEELWHEKPLAKKLPMLIELPPTLAGAKNATPVDAKTA